MVGFEKYIQYINNLVYKHNYKPLPTKISEEARFYYKSSIPSFFNSIDSETVELYSLANSLITTGFERIVIGDYGTYVEFNHHQANDSMFEIKEGEEYRVNNQDFFKNVKYYWFTIKDGSGVKIYLQNRTVDYADYKPNMFYVCISEVKLKE